MDSVTILFAGNPASKTVSRDADGKVEITDFNAGTRFGVRVESVSGIDELSRLLAELERIPSAFVIRGAPLVTPAAGSIHYRRKTHFLTPARGRHWVLIDFDKLPIPEGVDFIENPKTVVEQFVQRLPEEFHDASYHYQLSSSAGFRAAGVASVHVWFWLEPARNDSELKRWAKAVNDKARCKLVDAALFNDVQPHYTAAPVFEGVSDPFPERSGLVRKSTPAVRLRVPKESSRSRRDVHGAGVEQSIGFEMLLAKIGDHPGGSGFHEAIIKATASYVSQHGRADTDREALYGRVRDRVLEADRSKHDSQYVEDMASREHIMAAIDGAIEKYGDRPESRRRSKLVPGLAAPEHTAGLSSSEAHQRLSKLLDKILGA